MLTVSHLQKSPPGPPEAAAPLAAATWHVTARTDRQPQAAADATATGTADRQFPSARRASKSPPHPAEHSGRRLRHRRRPGSAKRPRSHRRILQARRTLRVLHQEPAKAQVSNPRKQRSHSENRHQNNRNHIAYSLRPRLPAKAATRASEWTSLHRGLSQGNGQTLITWAGRLSDHSEQAHLRYTARHRRRSLYGSAGFACHRHAPDRERRNRSRSPNVAVAVHNPPGTCGNANSYRRPQCVCR
jgi:hypothetical protein